MAKFDMEQNTRNLLINSVQAVRAYADSDLSKHAIEMLDALAASYCLELINVAPEGLVRLQSALKQVSALRDVFANDGCDLPII